jgi:preprotein translocase subunit SecF
MEPMLQFVKPDINIDFVGKRKIAYTLSLSLIIGTFILLMVQGGPKLGIDFAGGTVIQVRFPKPVEIAAIKKGIATLKVGHISVQRFGNMKDNEFLIHTDRSDMSADEFSAQLEKIFSATTGGKAEIRRVEMVGPKVGKDLRDKAAYALFYSLLFITIYISGRFETKWVVSGVMVAALITAVYLVSLFGMGITYLICSALAITLVLFWFLDLRYAMGAIVALIHDVTITVGMFTFSGKEFTLPIIAALLTIVGYSLNDTIIVFDRIRENLKKMHKSPLAEIINRSVNETLSRTLLTSGTTLIVLVALFILGGGIIHDFAFTMIVGVVVGTYSSIYVASPILLAWQKKTKG